MSSCMVMSRDDGALSQIGCYYMLILLNVPQTVNCTYTLSNRNALPPLPVNCLEMIMSLDERCVPHVEQHHISGPSRDLVSKHWQCAYLIRKHPPSISTSDRPTYRLKRRPMSQCLFEAPATATGSDPGTPRQNVCFVPVYQITNQISVSVS